MSEDSESSATRPTGPRRVTSSNFGFEKKRRAKIPRSTSQEPSQVHSQSIVRKPLDGRASVSLHRPDSDSDSDDRDTDLNHSIRKVTSVTSNTFVWRRVSVEKLFFALVLP